MTGGKLPDVAKRRNRWCRQCGAERTPDLSISRNGLCTTCAIENHTASIVQMRGRSGPLYDRWAASVREAVDRNQSQAATG